MTKLAVVTGAGSGVGRAITIALAQRGWNIALIGSTEQKLRETIKACGSVTDKLLPISCDVSDASQVARMAQQVGREMGEVEVLVNSAGTNVAQRSLEELSLEDYRKILDVNLTGSYLCIQAFLPAMRRRGSGTIINIVSDAALGASAKAGPAYVASKFALRGLTQSINAEERDHGIRACAILPGDIDTPLLNKRPVVPDSQARAKMLHPDDVAQCVLLAIHLPPRTILEELLVRPR